MKPNLSNVTINSFETLQKYEYVSKEVGDASYMDDYSEATSDDYFKHDYI